MAALSSHSTLNEARPFKHVFIERLQTFYVLRIVMHSKQIQLLTHGANQDQPCITYRPIEKSTGSRHSAEMMVQSKTHLVKVFGVSGQS